MYSYPPSVDQREGRAKQKPVMMINSRTIELRMVNTLLKLTEIFAPTATMMNAMMVTDVATKSGYSDSQPPSSDMRPAGRKKTPQ